MVKNKLYSLIILEGFTVLALQILTSILVTPFWGNTFLFWSLSLFFAMVSLSLGYFLAPRLILKSKNINELLVKILLITNVYLILLFIFCDQLLTGLLGIIATPVPGIILSLVFFILIPVTLLATIPVIVIFYQKVNFSKPEGEISGFVFSVSSVSGIFAIILLSFILIPYVGLKFSLITIVLLFGVFQLNYLKLLKKNSLVYLVVGMTLFSAGIFYAQEKKNQKEFFTKGPLRTKEIKQGILGELKVVDDFNREAKFLYVNNVPQSKAHPTGRSLYAYVFSLSIYSSYKPPGSKVLLAGMGAGNLVYELSQFRHDIDVVDIDPRLLNIARKHFLLPQKDFSFINSDIRRYIKKNQDKKYDVIILDLSIGESVPTNVYTLESFIECKNMLNQDGILLIHFLSSLSQDGKMALASVGKTLKKAGLDYRIMNRLNQKHLLDGVENPEKPDAFIFLAGNSIDLSDAVFSIDPDLPAQLIPDKNNLFLEFNDDEGIILTDDRPYLDVLQHKNVINLRKENITAMKQSIQSGKN